MPLQGIVTGSYPVSSTKQTESNMSDGGKGSKPRPFSVSHEEWSNRWDAIFGRDLKDDTKERIQTVLPKEAEVSPETSFLGNEGRDSQ
jgi:hypothetical protein